MQLLQSVNLNGEWSEPLPENSQAQWILAFGDRQLIANNKIQSELQDAFLALKLLVLYQWRNPRYRT
ncbi:MAG: hypothetical protein ACJA11_003468 [Glaciecola sp.]|jgi:hypothetical protein